MTAGSWTWLTRGDDWKRVSTGVYRRAGRRRQSGSCPRGTPTSPFFEYPVQLADGRWRYPDVAYPPPVLVGFEAQSYEHHSTLEAGVDTAP